MVGMFQLCHAFDQDLSGFDVSSVTSMEDMLTDGALSTSHYDALLIAWDSQAVQSGVTFHAGNSKYTAGGAAQAARTSLDVGDSWSITDGGTA